MPHGVVDSMVTLAGQSKRHAKLRGLVNAVLRKVSDTGPQDWAILRLPRLPKWLRGPLVEAWSASAVAAMEVAHAAPTPLDLTVKTPATASEIAAQLGAQVLPTGQLRVAQAGQVTALAGFKEGTWWVQDAAAALPAVLLDAQPGERVLDLCAAPGGKTMQLAASGAEVTAVDVSAGRLDRLKENLERTALNATCIVADALQVTGEWDAILLDAPCSATGTIRRHPDLPHAKDGSEFGALIDLQAQMIDHAWGLLAPGGRMVFCTCSLLPDEGEVQIEEALARHPDMHVDSDAIARQGIEPDWAEPLGGLRLRPDFWAEFGGMDGFYMVVLRKARDSVGQSD
jgi:16S rRNA (cytosine967-C5)-methyltransferase